MAIIDYWKRINNWANQNAPMMLEDLQSGATSEDICKLEEAVGRSLPADYKESLMIHNGEKDGWPSKIFADYGTYLSIDGVIEDWNQRISISGQQSDDFIEISEEEIDQGIARIDGPVKPILFSKSWIPFMDCNGDVFWALDFDPSKGGKAGQIIEVDWEGLSWRVIANSFTDFLESYTFSLESGEYEIDEDGHPFRQSPDMYDDDMDPINALLQNEPYIDDLLSLKDGEKVTFIVGCNHNEPDPPFFKVHGGEVKLIGKLESHDLSMAQYASSFLRVHTLVKSVDGEKIFEVVDYEVLNDHE